MKLKTCPFCGGKADMYQSDESTARFNEGAVHFAVQCLGLNCGHGAKANIWQITKEDAANAWNERAPNQHPLTPIN